LTIYNYWKIREYPWGIRWKSTLGVLVKGTKIKIFCWNIMKTDEFNLLQVKKLFRMF